MSDPLSDIIELVAETVAKDPRLSKVVDEAKWYAGLLDDPAWKRLAEKVQAENDKWLLGIAKRQFKGEIISQREIDTQRGFVLGALFTIRHPEKAEKGLESASRIAWQMVRAEAENLEEEDLYA